jgi:hypothetical protein
VRQCLVRPGAFLGEAIRPAITPVALQVMAISRPDDLGDITNLGLTLAEAKLLLAQVQQQLVAEQVNIHGTFRPDGRTAGRAAGYVR